MAYKTFSEFILTLHAVDEEAARYLARECIKEQRGQESLVNILWSPIEAWNTAFNCYNFWACGESPQGRQFWLDMNTAMRAHQDRPKEAKRMKGKVEAKFQWKGLRAKPIKPQMVWVDDLEAAAPAAIPPQMPRRVQVGKDLFIMDDLGNWNMEE